MRGTEYFSATIAEYQGITPACAGNSYLAYGKEYGVKDHPRVCGEQAGVSEKRLESVGSPPRVRGTVRQSFEDIYGVRITPACAGNSAKKSNSRRMNKDHPRVCGEQGAWCIFGAWCRGSPPRVRGTA